MEVKEKVSDDTAKSDYVHEHIITLPLSQERQWTLRTKFNVGPKLRESGIANFQLALSDMDVNEDIRTSLEPSPYPPCGICFEAFRVTYSPISASQTAMTSSHLIFGLRLPCPEEHSYCQPCLAQYIRSKIAPDGDYSGIIDATVFPIKCPECPEDTWPEGISDDIAQRILNEKDMLLWVRATYPLLEKLSVSWIPSTPRNCWIQ